MTRIALALAIALLTIDAVLWFALNGFWYGVTCLTTNVGIAWVWEWAYQ